MWTQPAFHNGLPQLLIDLYGPRSAIGRVEEQLHSATLLGLVRSGGFGPTRQSIAAIVWGLMTSTAVLDLGQRLRHERARRFVGRAAELELFAARLEAAAAGETAWDLFSVLWVHGPGGIGKSTLLGAYAETAHEAGFTVVQVDGGRIRPTPVGIQTAVNESLAFPEDGLDHLTAVVIMDAAERLEPAEGWLREEFLPSLAADTLVVIASRRPPSESWRSDPGWRELLRLVSLRNLSRVAVQTLLEVERIPREVLDSVMALTHGNPLAVSLLIDCDPTLRQAARRPDSAR
jgi:hypothetical protein